MECSGCRYWEVGGCRCVDECEYYECREELEVKEGSIYGECLVLFRELRSHG